MFCSASCGPIVAKRRSSGGDVTRRRGGGDPVVEGHQEGRLGPAARVPRDAQALRIDLGAAREIVEAPDAVADEVPCRAAADEERAGSDQVMLGRAPLDDRLPARVEGLDPLPLADRVEAEGGEAVFCEEYADALVRFGRLAVLAVAARHEHARERRWAVGQVKQGRDVVPRPALVDDLFDRVPVAPVPADGAGVQRGIDLRHLPERRAEFRLQVRLAPRDVCRRFQCRDGLPPGVELDLRAPLEVGVEKLPRRDGERLRLENSQVIVGDRRGGQREQGEGGGEWSHRQGLLGRALGLHSCGGRMSGTTW